MNKILLVDTSYPINTRNIRILSSLKDNNNNDSVKFATWNRDNRDIENEHSEMFIFNKVSKYGNPLSKLYNLFYYYSFIKKVNSEYKPNIVIASHWDSLLIFSFLKARNQKLIYENLDIPTSSNSLLLKALQLIEKYALRKVDVISLASRFYKPLYSNYNKRLVILENKITSEVNVDLEKKNSDKTIISFIGVIRYADILENLINVILLRNDIILRLHGEGPDLQYLKNKYSNHSNIIFTGKYNHNDISKSYVDSDRDCAAYPSNDYNVKYAI